jgi:hypothetical protein
MISFMGDDLSSFTALVVQAGAVEAERAFASADPMRAPPHRPGSAGNLPGRQRFTSSPLTGTAEEPDMENNQNRQQGDQNRQQGQQDQQGGQNRQQGGQDQDRNRQQEQEQDRERRQQGEEGDRNRQQGDDSDRSSQQ